MALSRPEVERGGDCWVPSALLRENRSRKRARANRCWAKEPVHRFSSDVQPLSRATHLGDKSTGSLFGQMCSRIERLHYAVSEKPGENRKRLRGIMKRFGMICCDFRSILESRVAHGRFAENE